MIPKATLSIIILLFLFSFSPIKSISLISSSTIEKCINKDPSKNMTCSPKLLLSLTIQNAELQGSDSISTTLDQITDKDGNVQKLSSPVKITFSKTPVKVIYPATYFRDFNYFPKEKVIQTQATSCKDGNTDSEPTCGWAYSNGEKIRYSQGFCCYCSLLSFSSSIKRGLQCDGFLDISATAHCLIYDDLWYSAYNVDKYKIEYKIEINIIDTRDNSTISTLELSPQNIINTDKDKNILVKLIGDFIPTDLFPKDLSSNYLIIPTHPENHINVRLGSSRWMLVDKTKFTLDGNECDKIGVGFFAFNSQSEKCNVEAGSCLNNQIYHLYESDIQKMQQGKNPEYLLKYDKNYEYILSSQDFNSRSFSYYLKGNMNTLITLEINTQVFKFITNVSSGKIIHLLANDFVSMSEDGYIEIGITNTGYFIAQYIIVYDCNDNIVSLSSDEISLKPDEIKYFNKSIYTKSNKGKENKCNIVLKNSLGEKIDTKLISFNSTNEISESNYNSSELDNNKGGFIDGNKNSLVCEDLCTHLIDISCYVKNSCWSIMAKRIIILFAIILILVILFKFFKKICCCCKCAKKLFCCCNLFKCKKNKNKKKEVKSSDEESNYSEEMKEKKVTDI